MDEIGFLKKKNIEFESELNEARRDIDSYRQQIENMNKSKWLILKLGLILNCFRSEKRKGKFPRD